MSKKTDIPHVNDEEWGNIELPGLSDQELYRKKWNQVAALKGRKRPDQSEFMKTANPMQGQIHPNKGKKIPQIGRPGVPKPKGFGFKISELKKGKPIPSLQGRKRTDHSELMKNPQKNKGAEFMKESLTCEYCGKTANGPNYHRWHGENCGKRLNHE